jgi:hypothetical protein
MMEIKKEFFHKNFQKIKVNSLKIYKNKKEK